LPQVIVAVLILLVAAVVAEVANRVVTGSAKAAALRSAGFLGKVAQYAIWIFAILAAFAQLNVATAFVQTLFTGVVIAVSLALGLAFGLGGQASAARYLEHLQSEIKD
jgi:small-conductance mechanosensitive channel